MHKDPHKAAEDFIDSVIIPRRAKRTKDARAVRARSELTRKDLELGKRELAAAGIDTERFEKLAAERYKERKKLAEDERRRATDASAAAAERLKDLVPIVLPIDPIDTVIDEVTFIRGFAGQGRRGEWNIGPGDNWAKYKLDSSSDTENLPGRLSFFTLWQNEQDSPTTLMARANLVVNANLSCDASWNAFNSWFGATSQATATVRARTTVWNMDSTISSIVHEQVLASAAARGNFFGDDSSRPIEFNELLPATGVSIAPQAYTLIEVELATEWQEVSGSVVLDAESGSHRVDVPQLVLTEVRSPAPPPISLLVSVSYQTSPATVSLVWVGATTGMIDIYQNGVRRANGPNDGAASFPLPPGTYVFRICEIGSTVCSNESSVTVTQ